VLVDVDYALPNKQSVIVTLAAFVGVERLAVSERPLPLTFARRHVRASLPRMSGRFCFATSARRRTRRRRDPDQIDVTTRGQPFAGQRSDHVIKGPIRRYGPGIVRQAKLLEVISFTRRKPRAGWRAAQEELMYSGESGESGRGLAAADLVLARVVE